VTFRDRLDVEALLTELGIEFERVGDNLKSCCPNPDHPDSNPSWTIVDRPGWAKHGGHRCFSCGFGGGPWELVQAVRGLDEEAAGEYVTAFILGRPRQFPGLPRVRVEMQPRAAVEYVLPPQVSIPSVDGSQWPDVFLDYLNARGVTQEQVVRWSIGFATRGTLAWRIVIPVHTRGRLVAHVARAVFDDRPRYDMPQTSRRAAPDLALFGEPLLDSQQGVITIAEGAFSMLALERAGAPNPVALLGSAWTVPKAAILTAGHWKHVLIATDPDDAGERVARELAVSFRTSRISRIRVGRSPDDCQSEELQQAITAALSCSRRKSRDGARPTFTGRSR
jgi:DNA primase